MKKRTLMRRLIGLVIVVIMLFSFTTVAYGNELLELYDVLFTEYTISGTIIQKDYDGIVVQFDNPISHPMSLFDIEYGYIEGYWNVSVGDIFTPVEKFQMFDIINDGYTIVGIFSNSVGNPNLTMSEEYISDEQTQQTLDWLEALPSENNMPSYNTDGVIYSYPRRDIIDSSKPFDPDYDDMTLFRLYPYNPGFMYVGMSEREFNANLQEWKEPTLSLLVGKFNSGNTIEKNGTYYHPLKEPIQYYGYSISWSPETGVVINGYLSITSGSNIIKNIKNGTEIILENNIEIIDGVTYVPIEFWGKAFPENKFKVEEKVNSRGFTIIDITRELAVEEPITSNPGIKVSIIHNDVVIDSIGEIEEGMEYSLLRLYIENTGYLTIGMKPPVQDEHTGQWVYSPFQKIIKSFNNGGKTFIKNDTYYFPMREVMEYYDHTVNWDPINGTTISGYVTITPGSNKITTRGIEATLSNPIELINGVTYVPIDFLQKAFPENKFKWTTQDRGNGCISIDITQEIAG